MKTALVALVLATLAMLEASKRGREDNGVLKGEAPLRVPTLKSRRISASAEPASCKEAINAAFEAKNITALGAAAARKDCTAAEISEVLQRTAKDKAAVGVVLNRAARDVLSKADMDLPMLHAAQRGDLQALDAIIKAVPRESLHFPAVINAAIHAARANFGIAAFKLLRAAGDTSDPKWLPLANAFLETAAKSGDLDKLSITLDSTDLPKPTNWLEAFQPVMRSGNSDLAIRLIERAKARTSSTTHQSLLRPAARQEIFRMAIIENMPSVARKLLDDFASPNKTFDVAEKDHLETCRALGHYGMLSTIIEHPNADLGKKVVAKYRKIVADFMHGLQRRISSPKADMAKFSDYEKTAAIELLAKSPESVHAGTPLAYLQQLALSKRVRLLLDAAVAGSVDTIAAISKEPSFTPKDFEAAFGIAINRRNHSLARALLSLELVDVKAALEVAFWKSDHEVVGELVRSAAPAQTDRLFKLALRLNNPTMGCFIFADAVEKEPLFKSFGQAEAATVTAYLSLGASESNVSAIALALSAKDRISRESAVHFFKEARSPLVVDMLIRGFDREALPYSCIRGTFLSAASDGNGELTAACLSSIELADKRKALAKTKSSAVKEQLVSNLRPSIEQLIADGNTEAALQIGVEADLVDIVGQLLSTENAFGVYVLALEKSSNALISLLRPRFARGILAEGQMTQVLHAAARSANAAILAEFVPQEGEELFLAEEEYRKAAEFLAEKDNRDQLSILLPLLGRDSRIALMRIAELHDSLSSAAAIMRAGDILIDGDLEELLATAVEKGVDELVNLIMRLVDSHPEVEFTPLSAIRAAIAHRRPDAATRLLSARFTAAFSATELNLLFTDAISAADDRMIGHLCASSRVGQIDAVAGIADALRRKDYRTAEAIHRCSRFVFTDAQRAKFGAAIRAMKASFSGLPEEVVDLIQQFRQPG